MPEYALYKKADPDAERKRQALVQALSAIGGGGAGYLLTRYGLGLKDVGAGIAGAGLGAVAGAGAGAVLNRMGSKQREDTSKWKEKKGEAAANAEKSFGTVAAENVTGILPNVAAAPVTGFGAYLGWKSYDPAAKLERIATTAGNVASDLGSKIKVNATGDITNPDELSAIVKSRMPRGVQGIDDFMARSGLKVGTPEYDALKKQMGTYDFKPGHTSSKIKRAGAGAAIAYVLAQLLTSGGEYGFYQAAEEGLE
jgi:hypothetical protein